MSQSSEDKLLNAKTIEENILSSRDYKYGFTTNIETDSIPKGLNEATVCLISEKKNEPAWLRDWRLKAYHHWTTMKEPHWANIHYGPIDYQAISYYNAPQRKTNSPQSMKEI